MNNFPLKQSSTKKTKKRKNIPLEGSPQSPPKTLLLPAQFESLDVARQFVAKLAEEYGLGPSAIYAVQMAVDEAVTNIIEHAYGGECQEKIECTCQITGEGLVITLRDCGKPFKPEEIPDPDLTSDLEDRQVGGLGLYFMHQLMDEVDFSFDTSPERKHCNILRMVKRKEKAR